ncbi:unnamed protein product [Peronospora belbahrii]|uniref:Uncharacterized protein n=1 Tax=Peronospora belbahrii TaxID=622444 RepID=A0AAU9L7T9_9STRA|nr:unnamed protein product [Peronospora belbahrii]CAH0518254.1 unnamed protein product [Peronospora belbahrii]
MYEAYMSMAKKLQKRSQSLVLRSPARSLSRTSRIVVTGVMTSASAFLLLNKSTFCQDAIILAAAEGPVGNNGPDKKNDDPMEKIIDAVMGNCSEFTMADHKDQVPSSAGFSGGFALGVYCS